MEQMLTRAITVLKRVAVNAAEGIVIFGGPSDQEGARPTVSVLILNRELVAALGEPEHLTVTVDPGDRLNDQHAPKG